MKFLVVLVAIVVATVWRQDLDQIDDRWFFKLRSRVEQFFTGKDDEKNRNWVAVVTFTYLIPLLLLGLVLWICQGLLFGLVSMLVHVFILLMAFDRIQPGILAQQFLRHWEQGDYEACHRHLDLEMGCTALPSVEDPEALHETFKRLYVYRCFERMFVTLFWYLVAGPLGVLFAYISYQLRYRVLRAIDTPEADPIAGIIQILEWIPLRLLALTLGLVGNFEGCFRRLKKYWLGGDHATDRAVYEYAQCAIEDSSASESGTGGQPGSPPGEAGHFHARVAGEIESLQSLMRRSQFVWLTLFALVTVLGWQF